MTLMSRRSQSNADKMVAAVCILFALAVAVATALHVPHTAFSEQLGVLREQNSSHMCKPGLKQLTGYFNIDPNTDKNYFYWYFPSEGSPETDPVILWLTGGPGCSGELALFSENGPCTINATGIYENPYTWTAAASVIYIDQPAGTGFSYANEGGYDTDEEGVSRDLDIFVRTFLSKHPEVENNPFYIFGESYGGHYVPATAWRIYSRNAQGAQPRINLEGIGIGNGLTNPMIQYQYYPEMIYNYTETKLGTPLVSLSTYEEMVQNLPYCIDLIRRCNDGDSSACVGGMSTCGQIVMLPFQMTGRNVYDIRIPCEYPPLCYDFSPITKFLNDPAVQKAIGVNREWQGCNMDVNEGFRADFLRGYEQHIPDLLEAGIRVVIYAGDCDYICNWIGNFHWTLALEWSGQTDFQNANDNSLFVPGMREAAGTIRTARGFTFVKVLDAGHMVPRDQPYIAQYLVNEFIRGSPSEKHV